MRKALCFGLLATVIWDISHVHAQPIPVPEIRPPSESPPAPPPPQPMSESESLRERWALVARKFREMEANADHAEGFLVSKELRSCQCNRPDAWAVVRALDEGRYIEGGTNAELRCGFCILQKYTQWQERVSLQCALMLMLSPFELERLEKSDDAHGLPKRCFERARSKHKAEAKAKLKEKEKEGPPPKVWNVWVERKEGYRYLRVVAPAACSVSIEGTGLQFSSKDWVEVPPHITQLKLKSTCQATLEVFRGIKAEFERIEHLAPGETAFLAWEKD
ncbi:MAG: hypothetical protein FWD46_05440 [Cystobacterineae bacterium]|nr:hypothetical protein [Cystobacterineae bacterium]